MEAKGCSKQASILTPLLPENKSGMAPLVKVFTKDCDSSSSNPFNGALRVTMEAKGCSKQASILTPLLPENKSGIAPLVEVFTKDCDSSSSNPFNGALRVTMEAKGCSKQASILTPLLPENKSGIAPLVEVFGEDCDSSTWHPFNSRPDIKLLVAFNIFDTLLNRLTFFFDENFFHLLDLGGIKSPPFHNEGESLSYQNVIFEYSQRQTRNQERAEWKDESPDLKLEWLKVSLHYAESGYVEDLVNRGVPLREDPVALKSQIRRELKVLVNSDGSERPVCNSTADPFGCAVAQRRKNPEQFSFCTYGDTWIMGSYGRCLSYEMKRDLLFMLEYFAVPENVPETLQKYSMCISLQGAFLHSVIKNTPLKPGSKTLQPPSKRAKRN